MKVGEFQKGSGKENRMRWIIITAIVRGIIPDASKAHETFAKTFSIMSIDNQGGNYEPSFPGYHHNVSVDRFRFIFMRLSILMDSPEQ